jgi:hypothetical protein
MKVVADWEVTMSEETKDSLKGETFVYYSYKQGIFLMSDVIYKKIISKYGLKKFEGDYEDEDSVINVFDTLDEFLECHYEQEDETFLNKTYEYCDVIESTLNTLTSIENEETGELSFVESDWMIDVEKYMKIEMSTLIMGDIRDELNDFKLDGFEFDYNILK